MLFWIVVGHSSTILFFIVSIYCVWFFFSFIRLLLLLLWLCYFFSGILLWPFGVRESKCTYINMINNYAVAHIITMIEWSLMWVLRRSKPSISILFCTVVFFFFFFCFFFCILCALPELVVYAVCISTREIFLQIKFNLETMIGNLLLITFACVSIYATFFFDYTVNSTAWISLSSRVKCNTMMRTSPATTNPNEWNEETEARVE